MKYQVEIPDGKYCLDCPLLHQLEDSDGRITEPWQNRLYSGNYYQFNGI